MHRRTTLHLAGTAGLALLAGCSDDGSSPGTLSTDGTDDDPIEADANALLLSTTAAADVVGGDWERTEPHQQTPITRSSDATAGYVPVVAEGDSGPAGWINAGVWTFDTVDAARGAFDGHGYQTGYGFDERDIAVESIAGTVGRNDGVVLFRDANAMGGVARTDPHDSGDSLVETSLELAVSMHSAWRDG
ncbi:hypothetical protein [Halovivax cerinus]|uniref:Uncharacterized protein n=1 Tax=Halovivax cerinus TaxID=1487865 RepID=A0ABD5NSF2_9EURY|nr:hypothetical protein [Halovivax cerinus]